RCLWDLGGERGLEIAGDSLNRQERFVTFAIPGPQIIQVTAMNGSQAVRRSVTVQVDPPRADTLVARVRIIDRGVRTEKHQATDTVPITLVSKSTQSIAINRQIRSRTGFTITDARLGTVDPAFTNLKAAISPDRHSVQITGSLSPTSAMLQAQ